MSEQGSDEPPEAQALWPQVDDDEPPGEADETTRRVEVPADVTRRVELPAEATRRIQVPPPAPPRPDFTQVIKLPPPPQPRPPAWPPPEPPRATPMRIGPPPNAPADAEPRPRRRGRKIALIVAAALIVVAGAGTGVVFAVPGLAKKLGLSTSDSQPAVQPPAPPIQFAPALKAPGGQELAPTAAGVKTALTGPVAAPVLGTLTGTVLDPATGEALWDQGGTTPLVPASTGKLLTSAAALLSLNHTEQLVTKVVAGKDPGSVVIVGGGDPTLSSLKAGVESVYPGAAHLSDLVAQVKASGVPVQSVYIDLNRYTGNSLHPSWDPQDVAGGYIAPIVPAMLDGGRGDATKDDTPRSANPARTLVDEFAARMGAKAPADASATAPPNAKVLGEVRSAPVVELVDNLLQRSDNVLAEAMGREVAKAAGEEVSFAGVSKAVVKVLQQNGFDTSGMSMVDGSGLSGQDKVPAKLLASILATAAGPDGKDPRTAKLRPLLGGLPVAGGSGTLEDRYNTPGSSVGKGWVRAKTGTLSTPAVNSLAGVVLDADGRLLVFAFMTNGSVANTARPALDTIAATLRQCGCR